MLQASPRVYQFDELCGFVACEAAGFIAQLKVQVDSILGTSSCQFIGFGSLVGSGTPRSLQHQSTCCRYSEPGD